MAAPIIHPAAIGFVSGCRVAAERAVGNRRAALAVVHPATVCDRVPRCADRGVSTNRAVGNRRAASYAVDSAAHVGKPVFDGKAINN
ncbi:hypothetical protein ES703_95492 [subsurface metagenome]